LPSAPLQLGLPPATTSAAMLYFPLFKGYFPEWLPYIGGRYFSFFDPVFNIADMAISTGVGLLLVFNKKVFPKPSVN
jgi:signal peptidase II